MLTGISDLERRIRSTPFLEQTEKTVLGFLAREPMTPRQIVDCLMSSPFDWNLDSIIETINGLRKKGLLQIEDIRENGKNLDADVYLTFAADWVCKI